MFSLPFFGGHYIFYNLPLFISEVGWIATHNLCLGNHKVTKYHSTNKLIFNILYSYF